MSKIKTKEGKFTKIYLKKCRGLKKGCNHQFFTTQPNKLYCSAWCRRESILISNRNSRAKKLKNPDAKKRKHSKKKGTKDYPKYIAPTSIIGYISPQTLNYTNARFFNEIESVEKMKKQTFHYPKYKKGKQNNKSTADESGASSSLLNQYQYLTVDDLYQLSTSYLKENNLKCPECGNKQNLVERALLVCSNPKCGLVLGAPVLHPGFVLYDLTPIKKIAPTVQDFTIDFTEKNKKSRKAKSVEVVKEAHDSAYQKYKKETGSMFEEVKEYSKNDPLNPIYWMKRKKCQQN